MDNRIYVGIDVHKQTFAVTELEVELPCKTYTMPADAKALGQRLKRKYPDKEIYSAYEAGYFGFGIHRELMAAGIKNIVVHPAAILVNHKDRFKTDRRDSRKIAAQLSSGMLKGIYVPTEQEEVGRLLCRTRRKFAKQQVRLSNQVTAALVQFGCLPADYSGRMTQTVALQAIRHSHYREQIKTGLIPLLQSLEETRQQIAAITKGIKVQAKNNPLVDIYYSAPGIGMLSAANLAFELGDMSRFRNERQIFSYTGLTPKEHSSGDTIRRYRISRLGPGWLRGLLVECAWAAIKYDEHLKQKYLALKHKTGNYNIAIVGVARRLIGQLRACAMKGVKYGLDIK